MKPAYQAADRACARRVRQRGAWSTRARSPSTGACAIARRWPRPRSSTSPTRRRRSTSSSTAADAGTAELAERVPALAGRDVSVLIWTTTPWTIPANLGVAFHPDFDYAAFDVDGRAIIVADGLADAVGAGDGPRVRHEASRRSPARRSNASRSGIRSTTASRSACSPTYVTLEQGTGRRAHGARPRRRRLRDGREVRARRLRADRAVTAGSCPRSGMVAGLKVFEANPVVETALAERGRLFAARRRRTSRIRIAGAATSRSSSSRRRSGSSAWTRFARRPRSPRATPCRGPALGPRTDDGHVRQPARLVHLAPARLGRADSGAGVHRLRRVRR